MRQTANGGKGHTGRIYRVKRGGAAPHHRLRVGQQVRYQEPVAVSLSRPKAGSCRSIKQPREKGERRDG